MTEVASGIFLAVAAVAAAVAAVAAVAAAFDTVAFTEAAAMVHQCRAIVQQRQLGH